MKYKKFLAAAMAAGFLLSAGMMTGGCGSAKQQQGQQQAMKVTTFKPFKSDTPIQREYAGSIMALQEVPVRSKVSGTVMEKYVKGGDHVTEGQPLFRLDTRTYSSSLAAAEAQVAQASATYENAKRDLARYEQLIATGAISRQAYDAQKAATESYQAVVEAAQSQAAIASDNLSDTIVTAPFTGTLSMDDVNIGTFASAGQTPLVTISSADPLYVQFDMSESEYLSLTKNKSGTETLGDTLKLRLADGSIYQETGKIVQINPGLTGGQLTLLQPLVFKFIGLAIFTFGMLGSHSVACGWVGKLNQGDKAQSSSMYMFFYYAGASSLGTLGGVFLESYGWSGVIGMVAAAVIICLLVVVRLELSVSQHLLWHH